MVAAALAGGLAAAGCGAGGPSEEDYARDLDRFCGRLSSASADVVTDADAARRRAGRPSDAVRRLGPVLVRFADRTDLAVEDLRDADPPAPYAAFHREAVSSVQAYAERVRRGAELAAGGDPAALRRAAARVSGVQTPEMPEALGRRAPACRSLAG